MLPHKCRKTFPQIVSAQGAYCAAHTATRHVTFSAASGSKKQISCTWLSGTFNSFCCAWADAVAGVCWIQIWQMAENIYEDDFQTPA